jgi:hypothetical protein
VGLSKVEPDCSYSFLGAQNARARAGFNAVEFIPEQPGEMGLRPKGVLPG